MYIVSFNRGQDEIIVSDKSLSAILHVLESNKTSFTVSNSMGKLSYKDFGWGIYAYWIQDWELFN
jgi:hypothetical protein